ncbi:MAG: UDP-N-acetylmuramoyl-L-alanyl-D-glutamate--2,6-diaminopimelate ligase, partial [Gammaproteobacteria bacterium]|nr:UDP-N-acetylmuramoyl-L-alanyl-D-glutamate--2,6-diaminopimelate ligase [Gammaproteobacteria bacterium]
NNIFTIPVDHDLDITGLALSSKAVNPGDLFFAFPGVATDGRKFIDDAIAKGAVAVLAEGDNPHPNPPTCAPEGTQAGEGTERSNSLPCVLTGEGRVGAIPIFYLEDLAFTCGIIAAQFYDHPSKKLQVIGVTGTNGKTSCTHYLAAAFTKLGIKAAVMGTVGNGIFGEPLKVQNQTTLDPISIQRFLADMVNQQVQVVAMEVSSHALCQGRVSGVEFCAAIFTNLTQDHLDYHGDMESYWAAKRSLFEKWQIPHMIINADDQYGRELLEDLAEKKDLIIIGYRRGTLRVPINLDDPIKKGTRNVPLQIYSEQVVLSRDGTKASIQTPWGDGILQIKQIGRFNLSNILAVLATMGSLGISLDEILQSLKNLPLVPGRLQTFNTPNKPLVVVDYAHTPDALKNVLTTLRENCQGKLWCVFGCGGDRDATKRPIMGGIAEQLADTIIVTDDNPRTEQAEDITAQIIAGLNNAEKAIIEHNRTAAINYAIKHADLNDIILVAGKGHEDYQEIGTEKHHYSDIETVTKLLDLIHD